jgi:hypothetical protein
MHPASEFKIVTKLIDDFRIHFHFNSIVIAISLKQITLYLTELNMHRRNQWTSKESSQVKLTKISAISGFTTSPVPVDGFSEVFTFTYISRTKLLASSILQNSYDVRGI